MKWIIFLFLTSVSAITKPSDDKVYVFTNYVDHMSVILQSDNRYQVMVSSCTFQVKCEGRIEAIGDSLVIKSKRISENTSLDGKESWKKTSLSRKIEKRYFDNLHYMIQTDSTLVPNEIRWKHLTFREK